MVNRYTDKYIKIAQNIKRYRKNLGLSQEELAEKMSMSRSYLSKIEAPYCEKSFSVETLFIIADALKIPAYKLLQFDEDEEI